MIGPEPHQPLGESDFGSERGLDANLGLFEIDRPPRIRDGLGGDLGRHLAHTLRGTLRHRGCVHHLLSFCVLFLLCDNRLGLPLRIGFVDCAEGFGT